MGRAASSGQRGRIIAGRIGGRSGGCGGGCVHGRGRVMSGRHVDRRSAHIQPTASGCRLVHIPPTGSVDSGSRFLFDVLLKLPRLFVRMVSRAGVHVRRLVRMAEVKIATVRSGCCGTHSGSLVIAGHTQSGGCGSSQTGDGRSVGVGRRGAGLSLPRLSVLSNAVELAVVVIVIVVVVESTSRCG